MTGPDPTSTRRPASAGASTGPTAGERLDLAGLIGAFGQLLHAAGVPVTPERSGRFVRAVVLARPATTDELYWAGRVTLLSGHDQIEVYDRVFAQVFRGVVDVADARGDPNAPELPPPASRPAPERRPGAGGRRAAAAPSDRARRSRAGRGRRGRAGGRPGRRQHRGAAPPDELRVAHARGAGAASGRCWPTLPLAPPPRLSRRRAAPPGRSTTSTCGPRCAAPTATAATPSSRSIAAAKQRPRRLVLLADISGLDGALRTGLPPPAARRGAGHARRGLRVRHPPDAPHPGPRRRPTPTWPWPGRPPRCPTGRVAPASAPRSRTSTTATAVAGWPEEPSS